MEKLQFTKIRDVKSPSKAHETDAGIDFYVPNDFVYDYRLIIGDSCLIPSGLKVKVPAGKALIFFNKSGIASKMGLDLGACVVDSGFEGEVIFNLHRFSTRTYNGDKKVDNLQVTIEPGTKIVQGILIDLPAVQLEEISNGEYSNESTRGAGGFGSTGGK